MLMSVKLANLHLTVGWLPIQQVGDYVQVRTEVIASLGLNCMVCLSLGSEINKGECMNHKPYNGWYNYETWCFNVWYGTDQFQEPIAEMLEHYVHREDDILTPEDRHIICLRDYLKEWMEELNDDQLAETNGFLADILGAGLQEINWFELAKSYYEGYTEEHGDRS